MSKVNLAALRRGDIVKSGRTLEVISAGDTLIYFKDVQSGQIFSLYTDGSNAGSWTYQMVKRVPRPKPYVRDVVVGDVLTGAQVKARPWKRGTHLLGLSRGHHLLLSDDGNWYSPAQYDGEREGWFSFSELPDYATYRVLHVG